MWFGVIFAAYTVEQYFLSFYLIDKMKLPQAIPAVFLFIAVTVFILHWLMQQIIAPGKHLKFFTSPQRKF